MSNVRGKPSRKSKKGKEQQDDETKIDKIKYDAYTRAIHMKKKTENLETISKKLNWSDEDDDPEVFELDPETATTKELANEVARISKENEQIRNLIGQALNTSKKTKEEIDKIASESLATVAKLNEQRRGRRGEVSGTSTPTRSPERLNRDRTKSDVSEASEESDVTEVSELATKLEAKMLLTQKFASMNMNTDDIPTMVLNSLVNNTSVEEIPDIPLVDLVTVRNLCGTEVKDGCKWKFVKNTKGNFYTRSCYKCKMTRTCLGRKHAERCPEDPSFQITTYYGSHDHVLSQDAITLGLVTTKSE